MPRDLRSSAARTRRRLPAALLTGVAVCRVKKKNAPTDVQLSGPVSQRPRDIDPSLDDGYDKDYILVELRTREGGPGWIDTGGPKEDITFDVSKLRSLVHSRMSIMAKPVRRLDKAVFCPCAPERDSQLVVCLVPKSDVV